MRQRISALAWANAGVASNAGAALAAPARTRRRFMADLPERLRGVGLPVSPEKPGAVRPRPKPPSAAAWAGVPLVALAGCVDAIGWLRLHELFVSFISGTSTMFGVALAGGEADRAVALATVLALFASGAVLGEAVGQLAGRWRTVAVLVAVAGLLAG